MESVLEMARWSPGQVREFIAQNADRESTRKAADEANPMGFFVLNGAMVAALSIVVEKKPRWVMVGCVRGFVKVRTRLGEKCPLPKSRDWSWVDTAPALPPGTPEAPSGPPDRPAP